MSKVAKDTHKCKPRRVYACIPRKLLTHPPILHRNQPANGRRITAFDFKVLGGVLVAAWAELEQKKHELKWEGGGENMKKERHLGEQYKQDWKAVNKVRARKGKAAAAPPKRRHAFATNPDRNPYKSALPRDKAMRKAGREGYQDADSKYRGWVPETIKITLTRYALLRLSRLVKNGISQGKLDAALERLTQPIGTDDKPRSPLLRQWSETSSGQLELEVAGAWLKPPYQRVPLSLLACSAPALALSLFLHSINTNPETRRPYGKSQIKLDKLCERLGQPDWGVAVDVRALNRALKIVNAKLAMLYREDLRAEGLQVPMQYEMRIVRDHVRFEPLFLAKHRKNEKRLVDPDGEELALPEETFRVADSPMLRGMREMEYADAVRSGDTKAIEKLLVKMDVGYDGDPDERIVHDEPEESPNEDELWLDYDAINKKAH